MISLLYVTSSSKFSYLSYSHSRSRSHFHVHFHFYSSSFHELGIILFCLSLNCLLLQMFNVYIARATEFFGVTRTREIFEKAIQILPEKYAKGYSLNFFLLYILPSQNLHSHHILCFSLELKEIV